MGKEYEEIKAEISVRISTEDIDDILQRRWRVAFVTGASEQKSKESISENLHRSRSAEEEPWYCMIQWTARREN